MTRSVMGRGGVVKGAHESVAGAPFVRNFEVEQKVRMHLDATAACGIMEHKGLREVCHIDTDVL